MVNVERRTNHDQHEPPALKVRAKAATGNGLLVALHLVLVVYAVYLFIGSPSLNLDPPMS